MKFSSFFKTHTIDLQHGHEQNGDPALLGDNAAQQHSRASRIVSDDL